MRGKAPENGTLTEFASKRNTITQFTTQLQGLKCGRLCGNGDSKTRLSELRLAFGWNFLLKEDYHLGLNIQTSIPTGNDPQECFLFAPQNSNDDHWELGAGLSAHFLFWKSEDEEKQAGLYLDANVTHMFENKQRRCFDLCGKPLSRYMLAERLGKPKEDKLGGEPELGQFNDPEFQFKAEFAPVANITTFDVDVSVNVQADIAVWFNYSRNEWSWDLGYNFWARSCEKIKLDCNCATFPENTWALKGDSHVYGYLFEDDINGTFREDDPVALSATMNNATTNSGNNFGGKGVTTEEQLRQGRENRNIDKKNLAVAGDAEAIDLFALRNANDAIDEQINTSVPPLFIKQEDVNFARIKGFSHKLFTHLSYTCEKRDNWFPYFGLGVEIEFAHNSDNCNDDCCSTSCDTDCNNCEETEGNCISCGLSQWGIWAKMGVSFR